MCGVYRRKVLPVTKFGGLAKRCLFLTRGHIDVDHALLVLDAADFPVRPSPMKKKHLAFLQAFRKYYVLVGPASKISKT